MSKKNIWKQWEKLAYEYVKYLYKDSLVQKEIHTDDSHDSGFDGIWLLHTEDSNFIRQILMEAKYRTSQSSLPLNDCAKAIIIAFNLVAQKLYIVTNIPFAPQTIENVIRFKKRSNLEIKCISGSDLNEYIYNNKDYLIKECKLSEIFLNDIYQNILDTPVHDEGIIPKQSKNQEYISVLERENQIKQISQFLAMQGGVCLLYGNEGVGKSILCQKICEELEKCEYEICNIDLSLCSSIRTLYISILESIWGVSLEKILEDSDLDKYIDSLLSVGGFSTDSGIANAVKYILLTSVNKYMKREDIYLHYLLKYLDLIVKPDLNKLKLVIVFENINMISEEVFTFLIELINNLNKNKIQTLLEVRTPFLIQGVEDIQKSRNYFSRLKQCANNSCEIATFKRKNSIELIKQHCTFNDNVCDSLAYNLCDNPLEISNALKLINKQSYLSIEAINCLTDEELEEYWSEIGISANTTIITLINKLRNEKYFADIFELSVLLHGHIPFDIFEYIFGSNSDKILKLAIDSTIFKLQNNELSCKHLRYLVAIKKSCNINIQYKNAKKMLYYIETLKYKSPLMNIVELDILYILERNDNIPSKTLEVSRDFIETHQYSDALKILLKCIDKFEENIFCDLDTFIVVRLLFLSLECMREMHEENNNKYEYIYDLTKKAIAIENPEYKSNKFWYVFQLFLWHKEFVIGNLDKALTISKNLYDTLAESSVLFNDKEDYPGQVYNAYGLSIKMNESGMAAKTIFEEGITLYPGSYYVNAALLSQEGNELLKTNSGLAIKKYKKLLETVENKMYPYQEIIHTKTDISMASFLSGDFDTSIIWAQTSIEASTNFNMLSQKGRAKNILGCCQAAKKEHSEAIKTFRESIWLLKMSKSTLYLWRAELNLASTLLIDKANIREAKTLLRTVKNTLVNTFATKIRTDTLSVPYQSLLLILMYFFELKEKELIVEIEDKFENSQIIKDFSNLKTNIDWRNHFDNKVINYEKIVLVTG